MATDPFGSDGFNVPSGDPYRRERSREVSETELYEMKKHAAEHMRFKILLSTIEERVAKTEAEASGVRSRLSQGDVTMSRTNDELERINSRLTEHRALYKNIEGELKESVALAKAAKDGIDRHQEECTRRWEEVEQTLARSNRAAEAATAALEASLKHEKSTSGLGPIAQGILITVIATIASAVVTGGLKAYYLLTDKETSGRKLAPSQEDPPGEGIRTGD